MKFDAIIEWCVFLILVLALLVLAGWVSQVCGGTGWEISDRLI